MECDLFLRDHSPSLEQPEKFAIDIVVVSLTVKNWLGETLLPQDALPEARIIQFSCLTPQGTAISYTLADIALELLKRLDVVRSESPNRPILFIGHEIGGLIVKMVRVCHCVLMWVLYIQNVYIHRFWSRNHLYVLQVLVPLE